MGPVGISLRAAFDEGPLAAPDAAKRIEACGFRALWLGGGHTQPDAFEQMARLLAQTDHLVLATGVLNIWAWEPTDVRAEVASLEAAHPGRFLLGLGVSHAPAVEALGRRYEKPLELMTRFLDAYAAGPAGPGVERAPVVLAALGPRMLQLARERTDGAHPFFSPVAHTAEARRQLGDEHFLAPAQMIVTGSTDHESAQAARRYAETYLSLHNYVSNLRRMGYGDEDLGSEPSPRLVEAIFAWGDAEHLCARIRQQLDAGADHVCIRPVGVRGDADIDQIERLGEALAGI
jgi:probable F420-dependent oxidoreductase